MNILHHKLGKLYKASLFNYDSNSGIVVVNEKDANAKVKYAQIEYNGQLLKIDNEFLKGCHGIYEDIIVGQPELKHECDGILFINDGAKKYFILIELKSKYTESNIKKAEKQIAASYIRVLSNLLCIEDFTEDEYIKCGIIVSYAPSACDLRKNNLKKDNRISSLTRYEKQMRAFSQNYGCFILDKEFVRFDNLPIRSSLKFDKLPVFHINVTESNDSVKFNIEEILKDL
jgi:hypothetical protein